MLMGVSAYARHRGCTLTAVQYAVQRGRIQRRPDGLIDVDQADQDWEQNTAHSKARYGPKGPRKSKLVLDSMGAEEEESPELAAAATVRIKAGLRHAASNAAKAKAAEAAEHLNDPDRIGRSLDFAKARAAREIYDAKIKKLDYEERLGNLVPRKAVEVAAFNRFRVLRDACFNLPSRVASQIAAETDESIVFSLLENEVRSIFDDFSEGRIG